LKISVITVCFNSENTIEKTILSVLNQTYANIEYIIIDGNSTDKTLEILEKYRNKFSYFLSEPDTGMYNAMNKGIKKATGEWIFILNSDDLFFNQNSVEHAVNHLKNYNGDILLGDIYLDHTENPEIHNRIRNYKHLNIMQIYYNGLYQQAMFYRRNIFERLGYFDENYKIISDVDWFYKNHKNLQIKYIPLVFCKFRIGGRSASEKDERDILKINYLVKWQMNFYQNLKTAEKKFHWFAHKYFRSIARNKKISDFIRNIFWNSINNLMGWKIQMIKD